MARLTTLASWTVSTNLPKKSALTWLSCSLIWLNTCLMNQDNSPEHDDFQPRDYQMKLMEIALQNNTIIYLPTGTGKTFIAAMVLRQMSTALEKHINEGGKISIVLVNTVALVDQQAQYIKRFTQLKVGAFSGEMNVDSWNEAQWHREFNTYQVLVMTSQILTNLVLQSFLNMKDVNLLIFDECHAAVNDHAMRQVMKTFGDLTDEKPRVIGLTATLLNKNCTPPHVIEQVKNLETTFHGKVATIDELKYVIGFATNPHEGLKCFNAHTESELEQKAINCLEQLKPLLMAIKIDTTTSPPPKANLYRLKPTAGLKELVNLITDVVLHINTFGIFGGRIAVVAHTIQLERMKKHCQEMKLSCILNWVLTEFYVVKHMFDKAMEAYSKLDRIWKFSSDQVLGLISILKEYKEKSDEPVCGIVFVQRRFTAKVLYNILLSLSEADRDYEHIKPNFMVGNNCNPFNDTREGLYQTKVNKKVLDDFQNKTINLLVASNVMEEGIDIPTCTLVVKFDKPLDYRSYIQSKGRARHRNSYYYIMVDQADTEQYIKKYATFQKVEELLNNFLIGQNEFRHGPTEEDIQELYDEDEIQPYYVDGPGSPQVNILSAISLLCRYCLSLPADKYTVYTPNWYWEPGTDKYVQKCRVVIELPTVCPLLEPIEGRFMATKKMAKRSAALETCIRLHQIGELDHKLLPKKRDEIEEDVSYLFNNWPKTSEKGAGQTKMYRSYPKKIPNIITATIKPGETVFIHLINLVPCFSANGRSAGMICDVYNSGTCFGVLSANALPELCNFSVYVTLGEVNVEFQVNKQVTVLSEEDIFLIRNFNVLIYRDVLKVLKTFLVFSNNEESDNLLIVPLNKTDNCVIDFDILNNHKTLIDQKEEPSDQTKLRLMVSEENYLGKIVTPWYRSDDKQYLVTKVCTDMNALSQFPSEDFNCYSKYFKEKYQVTVLNPTHPLLLVKGLSKRLNCLRPRDYEIKRNKEKVYEEMEEHLIPELCIKQDFPAALWVQATLLPSILYRIITLLQAEELRTTIAKESGLGCEYLMDKKWLPLVLDSNVLGCDRAKPKAKSKTRPEEEEVENILQSTESIVRQINKDFDFMKLELQYPWLEKDEPVDIERNLNVTLMDIQYYENFLGKPVTRDERLIKNEIINKKDCYPAITFDKNFVHKDIEFIKLLLRNETGPELRDVYKALITAKCNDTVNLERLETLGDSFLKLSISLFILLKYPKYDEGKATVLKGRLISNKNLFYNGRLKNVANYLKNSEFLPSFEWKPPYFSVPNELATKVREKQLLSSSLFNFYFSKEEQIQGHLTPTNLQSIMECDEEPEEEGETYTYDSMLTFFGHQTVSDKTVADGVEALLGVYFQACGFKGGLKLLEWLEIVPKSEQIDKLLEMPPPNPVLNEASTEANIQFHIPGASKIEEIMGYKFKNRAYLLQALTHSSYTFNRVTNCYQTLEFLGDAVLDFLITCYIFENSENLSPGDLTDLRSALVNNTTFAALTVRCGLHKFLLFSNSKLLEYINNFVAMQEKKDFKIDDEVLILLEEDDLYLSEHVDVPKVLGDIFESVIGAIFLDSGMDFEKVWSVMYRIMWKEIELFSCNVPKNAVRVLYETKGAHPTFQKPVNLEAGGVMVAVDFMLTGEMKRAYGFSDNKHFAKKAAAKVALRLLHSNL